MARKPYHHGNLEEALIENGIKIINDEGFDNFSLRKVAIASGVSHAAPYKHFADKNELIRAMQLHVEERFARQLEDALQENADNPQRMVFLAKAYVEFFVENPHYFFFLTKRPLGAIDLNSPYSPSENHPFEVMRVAALKEMEARDVPVENRQQLLINMWAVVEGVTSLATREGIYYNGNWCDILEDMLPGYKKWRSPRGKQRPST